MSEEILQQFLRRIYEDSAFQQQLLIAPQKTLEGYDLTVEEKRQLVLPNFSWLIDHQVAGVSYPRSEDALTMLKALGIEALLNLTAQPHPSEVLEKIELEVEQVPVADFTTPTLPQIEQSIAAINSFLKRGLPVAVHCGAGLGRTGTVLACYLVWQGMPATTAIMKVRTQRPGSIETQEQESMVALYEQSRASLPLDHEHEKGAPGENGAPL